MKMKNYLLLLAAAGMFVFTACDDDDDETSLTKSQMLTARTWTLSARTQVTTDSAGTSTTDTSIDNCEKDDTYKFTTDNKVIIDEGATKCDPNDPQSTTGAWALTDNDTKLTLTVNGFSIPGELQEISASKMVLKSTIDIFGDKIVTTSTFVTQ